MRYRILYLESFSEVSGGQMYLLRLLDGLNKNLFSPYVVLPAKGTLSKKLKEMGVPFQILRMSKIRDRNPLKFLKNLFILIGGVCGIIKIIINQKIDLVNINADRAFLYGALAAHLTARPVVWCLHYVWRSLTGRIVGFLAALLVDKVVVNSEVVTKCFRSKKNLIFKINHGIDLKKYNIDNVEKDYFKNKFGLVKKDFFVGCIGQISPLKGQDVFIKSSIAVARYFPDAKFIIIGNTKLSLSSAYLSEIKSLIADSGIGNVVFFDFQEDLPSVLAALDIVVVPSLFEDPDPLVCLEAMAMERPVVACAVGGIPEMVTNGVNGILIPKGDVNALSSAIIKLLQNPDLIKRMGAAGRKTIEEDCRAEKHCEKMEEIYLKTLSKKRRGLVAEDSSGFLREYLLRIVRAALSLYFKFCNFFKKKKKPDLAGIRKILVLNRNRMGDLLFTTPALSSLKSAFPRADIATLIHEEYSDLLLHNHDISRVLTFKKSGNSLILLIKEAALVLGLKRMKFDLVVNFEFTIRGIIYSYLISEEICCGLDVKGYGFLLDYRGRLDEDKYWPEVYLDVIRSLGVPALNSEIKIENTNSDLNSARDFLVRNGIQKDDLIICVHPGSSRYWQAKRWPKEKFITLCNTLISRSKAKIIITGDCFDAQRVDDIAKELLEPALKVIGLDFIQLLSIIHLSDLMVSNDTGPMHLAVAAGIPLIALFGPTDPVKILPKRENIKIIVSKLECSPCQQAECKFRESLCMDAITAEDVINATLGMIEQFKLKKCLTIQN